MSTATVKIDLTNLGRTLLESPYEISLNSSISAKTAILMTLEHYGYDVTNTYVSALSRSNAFTWFDPGLIPPELQYFLKQDNITLNENYYSPSLLQNNDLTGYNNSYWLCAINDNFYVINGTEAANGTLSDGDVVTLYFTLNKGKDIGAAETNYCTVWRNGEAISNHQFSDGQCTVCNIKDPSTHTHTDVETITKAATCTTDGRKTVTCSDCGFSYIQLIKKLGHKYNSTLVKSGDKYQLSGICENCNDIKTKTLSKNSLFEVARTDSSCTKKGEVTYRGFFTSDGTTIAADITEELPLADHNYVNNVCTECGKTIKTYLSKDGKFYKKGNKLIRYPICINFPTTSLYAGMYNGQPYSPKIQGFNPDVMTMDIENSTLTAINANNYTIKFTPKENYCWEDGSMETKSLRWAVAKAYTSTPYISGNSTFTYKPNTIQYPTVRYDSNTTYIQTPTSVNAGDYYVQCVCQSNYLFSNGSSIKYLYYTINPASGYLNVPYSSINMSANSVRTIAVTSSHSCKFSLTNSTTFTITNKSTKSVTIKALKTGASTSLKITPTGSNQNYTTPTSKYVRITCN